MTGYAKAYGAEGAPKLEKAIQRLSLPGVHGLGRIVLRDTAIEVAFFPNDSKLKALARLYDPESQARLLKQLFRSRPALRPGTVTGLRYKPALRYVARLDVAGQPQVLLKLYSRVELAGAATAAVTFRSASVLRIPQLAAQLPSEHVVAFVWRRGRPLHEMFIAPRLGTDHRSWRSSSATSH